MREKYTYLFQLTYDLYYSYKLLKDLFLKVTLCVRSVISHTVWVYFFTTVRLKMSFMATKCLYGNYLVATINYIKNNKCVSKTVSIILV